MMPKYKQVKKRSWQNIFFAVLMGSLIFAIVGFFVVSNVKISKKRAILNSQIDQLKGQIQDMETKKQQLEAQLYQSSQEEHIEKEARETLNLQKPGEEVVVVIPPEEESGQEEEQTRQWWNPLTW